MTESEARGRQVRWLELKRTATLVRAHTADTAVAPAASRSWRRPATTFASLVVVAGLGVAAVHAFGTATIAQADGSADSALFSLVNQDRTSNGVRSLNSNGTLAGIGESRPYGGCGFTVNGRAYDMIQRNYFAHPILNCGQLVFSMMAAFGVHYRSAGENIGWNTYSGSASAASAINSAFMGSPDHRANILNPNYTDLGIGSDNSGSAVWTGGGSPGYAGAWMFSEEFAQLSSSPPPTPRPPAPKPRPSGSGGAARNSAPPSAPALPPAAATAAPTASPTAVPTAPPTAVPTLLLPPLLSDQGGLLFNSVESVLASFLID